MKTYKCFTCQIPFPPTEEYYFLSTIKKLEKNPTLNGIGKCKECCKVYHENYRKQLKEKKLTRKNLPPKLRSNGTLYIVGTTPDNPVKIGITTGSSLKGRLVNLQTSHWLDLKILYKSPLTQNINKLEKQLHEKYKKYWVRGEWFNLPEEKILEAQMLAENFSGIRIPEDSPRK